MYYVLCVVCIMYYALCLLENEKCIFFHFFCIVFHVLDFAFYMLDLCGWDDVDVICACWARHHQL